MISRHRFNSQISYNQYTTEKIEGKKTIDSTKLNFPPSLPVSLNIATTLSEYNPCLHNDPKSISIHHPIISPLNLSPRLIDLMPHPPSRHQHTDQQSSPPRTSPPHIQEHPLIPQSLLPAGDPFL